MSVRIVCKAHYPHRLRDLRDAPPELHVLGELHDTPRAIALVGARAASRAGRERGRALAQAAAAEGIAVVSGGALGIDTAAHEGAVLAGGYTIAVLGTGLDVLYPDRNRALFARIVETKGAVVSPFPQGSPPKGWHFVHRNRVIAGLVDLVVVVEASGRSGSLHTARAALAYGRRVAACPGSPGAERLLSLGAAAIESTDGLFDALAGKCLARQLELPLPGSLAGRVVEALRSLGEGSDDDLLVAVDASPREVRRALMELELAGTVLVMPGSRYRLSPLAMGQRSGESAGHDHVDDANR